MDPYISPILPNCLRRFLPNREHVLICDPVPQVGTKLFVEELGKRFFSPADDVMMKVSGRQLTLPYLNQSGFNHPILVTDRDGLSMTVPQVSVSGQ